MRGLVVLGVVGILLFTLLSGMGSAQSVPDVKPTLPTISASCTLNNGTTVVLKANRDIHNLEIGDYCSHDYVPSGWSVVCRTDKTVESVNVSFYVDGDERRTVLTCS